VSGTVGANANNNLHVAGMDWRCKIMPLKVLNQNNSGFYSWWASAIDWAIANDCHVINLSAGGSVSSIALSNAVERAIAAGVVFVTITHNDGTGTIRFPGRMRSPITVGATNENDERRTSSNYGDAIDLVAPGRNIRTIGLAGTLQRWSGTSFAAPLVSGVCALMRSQLPELDTQLALKLLIAGAEDQVGKVTEDTAGFDIYHGWGRLNAHASLQFARTLPMVLHADSIIPAVEGVSYERLLGVSGGTAPHAWSPVDLPVGLTVSANGRLVGIPATTGVFEVTVRIEDAIGVRQDESFNLRIDPDSDGDRISDTWELLHFGALTNASDVTDGDADRATALEEFLAGTSPLDSNDVFQLFSVSFAPSSTVPVVRWNSVSNRVYNLLRYTNLAEGAPDVVFSNRPGTPPLNVHTDQAAPPAGALYYRLSAGQ